MLNVIGNTEQIKFTALWNAVN